MSLPVRIVCATRKDRGHFVNEAALPRSLKAQQMPSGYELQVFFENSTSLGKQYNIAIEQAQKQPAILLFIQDDVYITDHFWLDRILEGLEKFDVIGVAGNRRCLPGQPSWAFLTSDLVWDAPENLSGTVAHGGQFPHRISRYGPSGIECQLLSGMFLAVKSQTLLERELRFDPQFEFHLHDMDFCRQAVLKGLRLGTWPISLVHENSGSFRSPAWKLSYQKYLEKYQETRR